MIDIGASVARLERDVAKANHTIEGFAKSAKSAFGVIAGYLSASAISSVIQNVTAAYMEQERALNKMGQAMKNQGDFSKAGLKDMEDYASAIQEASTVGDEAALSAMANLKSYGMLNDEVKRATQVAVDFAVAKKEEGMTVVTASELIGKAYAGNTATLSRYGIVIDENIKGAAKFEAVMQQLQARFGGAAQAELETYEGRIKNLQNTWGDVKEVLGAIALEIADPLIPLMKSLAEEGKKAAEGMNLALSGGAEARTSRQRMALLDQIHEAEAELKEFKELVELEGGRGTELGILMGGGGSAAAAKSQISVVEERIRRLHQALMALSVDAHKAQVEAEQIQPGGKRTVPTVGGKDDAADREKWLSGYLRNVDKRWQAEADWSEQIGELYLANQKIRDDELAEDKKRQQDFLHNREAIMSELFGAHDAYLQVREEQIEREVEDTEEANKKMVDLTKHTAKMMQDTFSDLFFNVMTGKFEDLEDVARGVLTSIQKMVADYLAQMATEAIFGKTGGLGGIFSLFGGGGTAAAAGAASAGMGAAEIAAYAAMFHSGGTVGQDGVTKRMPASIFANAPRFHGGLASDEYPAILQRGERVIPRNGESAQGSTFNVMIQAVDAASFSELAARNPQAIVGPFLTALQQGGQVRNAIRGVV